MDELDVRVEICRAVFSRPLLQVDFKADDRFFDSSVTSIVKRVFLRLRLRKNTKDTRPQSHRTCRTDVRTSQA